MKIAWPRNGEQQQPPPSHQIGGGRRSAARRKSREPEIGDGRARPGFREYAGWPGSAASPGRRHSGHSRRTAPPRRPAGKSAPAAIPSPPAGAGPAAASENARVASSCFIAASAAGPAPPAGCRRPPSCPPLRPALLREASASIRVRVTALVESRSSWNTTGQRAVVHPVAAEGAGRLGRGAVAAVHVQGQAHHQPAHALLTYYNVQPGGIGGEFAPFQGVETGWPRSGAGRTGPARWSFPPDPGPEAVGPAAGSGRPMSVTAMKSAPFPCQSWPLIASKSAPF